LLPVPYMTRGYALYFDRPRIDAERRAKQGVAIAVIVLHALLLIWALRTHPIAPPLGTSLVVVQLNGLANALFADRTKGDVNPKKPTPKPAASRARQERDTTPGGGIERAPVRDGRETLGAGERPLAVAGAISADANGVADTRASSRTPGGSGSIFGRFRPPQVIHRARMSYPKPAIRANAQGDVDVLVTIGADGRLRDASIDRSSGNADLDAASLQSMRLYEFKAAEKDGSAVEAQAIISLEWRIDARERFEFSRLPAGTPDINLDAQLKSIEFLRSMPSHRLPCEQMKNPDCLPAPSGE
jgi:protein TonB